MDEWENESIIPNKLYLFERKTLVLSSIYIKPLFIHRLYGGMKSCQLKCREHGVSQ